MVETTRILNYGSIHDRAAAKPAVIACASGTRTIDSRAVERLAPVPFRFAPTVAPKSRTRSVAHCAVIEPAIHAAAAAAIGPGAVALDCILGRRSDGVRLPKSAATWRTASRLAFGAPPIGRLYAREQCDLEQRLEKAKDEPDHALEPPHVPPDLEVGPEHVEHQRDHHVHRRSVAQRHAERLTLKNDAPPTREVGNAAAFS